MNFGRAFREMHRQTRTSSDRSSIALREDALFDLLADSRRRFVVERLAERGQSVPTVAALAGEIAADETHMAPVHVPRRRVDPVERDLREEHLPRLARAGVVQWTDDAENVWPGHSVDAIAELLQEVDRRVQPDPIGGVASQRASRTVDAWESRGRP